MKIRYNIRRRSVLAALFAGVLCLATGTVAKASMYDAVNDFSLAGNPSGAWSYGTVTNLMGAGFTKFSTAEALTGYSGSGQVWDNGGSNPTRDSIIKNTNGSTISGFTIVLPANELNLDSQSLIVDLRWTAPILGVYNVSGLFQRTDTSASPVSIRIVENNTVTLLTQDNFTTYGNTASYNFSALTLPAGTVLDFIEGAAQFNNDSTGIAATISTVPEPSGVVLMTLGGLGAIGGLKLRFRKSGPER